MSHRADPSPIRLALERTDVISLKDLLAEPAPVAAALGTVESASGKVREIGGRKDGLDPTRYGDWEKNGRCIDF